MIKDNIQLRPRYGEVDQMGYVYHANYVSYCHHARTELLRKYSINDRALEDNNVMLPVISFDIKYLKPAGYDELLTVNTFVKEMPKVRFTFEFEIKNEENIIISKAKSIVVFANSKSRRPIIIPDFVKDAIVSKFKEIIHEADSSY